MRKVKQQKDFYTRMGVRNRARFPHKNMQNGVLWKGMTEDRKRLEARLRIKRARIERGAPARAARGQSPLVGGHRSAVVLSMAPAAGRQLRFIAGRKGTHRNAPLESGNEKQEPGGERSAHSAASLLSCFVIVM